MFRGLLVCAGLTAFLAPALTAQNTVCVFQSKQDHAATATDSDANEIAGKLNTHSLQTVSVLNVAKDQEDAEAQKRGCTWIVTLWRQELLADTPNYAGTLGGTQSNTVGHAELEHMKITGGALLDFTLRKVDTRKYVAHSESDDASPYAKMADQIAKKIGKEK
ncbi:MAG TPA: hypothetical protein VHZ09_19230 [Acidobacteriaceae bacterium]|jgi:hypothetical protein|nr:hypothetical protein [Acidobacteriaceae bacterium]